MVKTATLIGGRRKDRNLTLTPHFKAYSAERQLGMRTRQMQDRVRFEMAIRKLRSNAMINPTITISQDEYEYLVEQAKIVKFIEHYKPSICNDGEFGTYEMVVGNDGLITTVRYGTLSECVKCAIEDIRAMQSVYWIGEETEIYAGNSFEEILEEFFTEEERDEILRDNLYGSVDLGEKYPVKEDVGSIAIEKTIKELLGEMVAFPDVVLSSYS